MHPAGLEEAVRITSLQGLSVLIENDHRTWSLGKLQHVVAQAHDVAGNGRCIGISKELTLMVGSSTEVDESVLVAILAEDGSLTVGQRTPPLELTAPETTEIAIDLAVVILEHAGVDGERAANGLGLRNERTFGLVGNSHTEVEHAVIAFG